MRGDIKLDVIFDANRAAVTISAVGADWVSTIDNVVVERDAGQGWQRIRGGKIPTAGTFAISDIEMPLHSIITYRVQGRFGEVVLETLTGTVDTTVSGECVFLKTVSDTNATVCALIKSVGDVESETQGGVYNVSGGGQIAVSAWGGVNADTFTLAVQTLGILEDRPLEALFANARVLLLQPTAVVPEFEAGWYFVKSVSRSRHAQAAGDHGHVWSLALTRAAEPSGEVAGVSGSSWGRVRASYDTGADVKAANAAWFDVLQGV